MPSKIAVVVNPGRSHKLLPLFEPGQYVTISCPADLFRLRKERGSIRAVLIDTFGRFARLGLLASILLRAPLVIRFRGEFDREQLEHLKDNYSLKNHFAYLYRMLEARVCIAKASHVIYNSRYLKGAIGHLCKGRPSSIVYNPFTEFPAPPDGGRFQTDVGGGLRLLSVLNLQGRSKVEPTLRAMNEWLPREMWEELDIHWAVCGRGLFAEHFMRQVAALGLEKRVHYWGYVADMRSAFDWSSVVVHMSLLDAFPNAPMEGMMRCRPCIANDGSCGTLEQIREGWNGFVVHDATSFQAAIRAYADPALREQHGRRARTFIEETYSLDAQKRAFQSVILPYLGA